MHDPTLYSNGYHNENLPENISNNKENGAFDLAYNLSITQYIEELLLKEDPSLSKLQPKEERRKKLELELSETLDFSEIGEFIDKAVLILNDRKSCSCLTDEEHRLVLEDLEKLRLQINSLEFNELSDETLKTAYSISKSVSTSIFNVGLSKFHDGLLPESLALFSFLSLLESDDPDIAYRLGIISQKNGRYDLALRAYTAASALEPTLIGSRLFAAQCYLSIGQPENALKEIEDAKQIFKISDVQGEWKTLVSDLEGLILLKAG